MAIPLSLSSTSFLAVWADDHLRSESLLVCTIDSLQVIPTFLLPDSSVSRSLVERWGVWGVLPCQAFSGALSLFFVHW
jgi:hypothetical protein